LTAHNKDARALSANFALENPVQATTRCGGSTALALEAVQHLLFA